jgi:hypothetical protein
LLTTHNNDNYDNDDNDEDKDDLVWFAKNASLTLSHLHGRIGGPLNMAAAAVAAANGNS